MIVIAPEVFQTISREIYNVFKKVGMKQGLDEDYFKFYNPFQAGDSFRVRLVITNLSLFQTAVLLTIAHFSHLYMVWAFTEDVRNI